MTILFGLALDEPAFPTAGHCTGGLHYLGPHGLLHFLETHLGLSGHDDDNEYLRIEQYRQALRRYLQLYPNAFYGPSFSADQFATATDLLSRRDELLLAGWDLTPEEELPPRLSCLAGIEEMLRPPGASALAPGLADRFLLAESRVQAGRPALIELQLFDPWDLLPGHLQRLFRRFEESGVSIIEAGSRPPFAEATDGRRKPEVGTRHNSIQGEAGIGASQGDLGLFQVALLEGVAGRVPLQADGSLLILKARRETHLAAFLAALLRRNREYRPLCLVPEKNRAFDDALAQEGLPSLGIPSASLARPTLQVLKLVTVFLWNPIDPFKVMEFVSLAVKPLHDDLANRIAVQMAQTPGLQGEGWQRTIAVFFAQLEERARRDPGINVEEVRRQYRFWFERRRYDFDQAVPKDEVISIFGYLERWARNSFDRDGAQNQSLFVLQEQARRIRELLEALPETQLAHLELERIVRTIYEPTPVQVCEQEKGCLSFVYQPHAVIGPVDKLLWWNFVQREPAYFFSRWYEAERSFLAQRGIYPEGPRLENERLLWQRKRPVVQARHQLILVIPEAIDGSPVMPHPLLGDLTARFGDLAPITFDVDTNEGGAAWQQCFDLPRRVEIPQRRFGRPSPFLNLENSRRLDLQPEETFTSLQSLFYYPYQWVFRHKLELRKSSILSIVPNHTLMGNLAHRLFERLLKEDVYLWPRDEVERWIDQEMAMLLEREGAVLLLYGNEPERASFLKRIKFAAWSLIDLIRNNGWMVEGTEQVLAGQFLGLKVNGRADLVLRRGEELAIIDLKWRGAATREATIRNEQDLQLVLYAKLLTADQSWAHSAYFILENGRLIARNNQAFKEITPIVPDADPIEVNQRIFNRMAATYHWRLEQIRQGRIEVRCKHTQAELETCYGDELMEILEMKQEDAPYDDYRTLIYLLE